MRRAGGWRGALQLLLWLLALLAPAAHGGDRELADAYRRLQEANRDPLPADSEFSRAVLLRPIGGSIERVADAIARVHLLQGDTGTDAELLRQHLSRLTAEQLLGRPPTRVPDVAAALAYERKESASLEALLAQAFVASFHPRIAAGQLGEPGPYTEHGSGRFRHLAPVLRLEMDSPRPGYANLWDGSFVVRIAGGAFEFRRVCTIVTLYYEWSAAPRKILECGDSGGQEPAGALATALQQLRSGQAGVEFLPTGGRWALSVAPAGLARSIPYDDAAREILAASCVHIGTCGAQLDAVVKRATPFLVVAGFVGLQILACVLLLRRAGQGAIAPISSLAGLTVVYLGAVVLAHAGTIAMALSPGGGSLLLLFAWGLLGLPLFGPGILVGLLAIFARAGSDLHRARVVLGVFAVTMPVLEVVLASGVIRSGYGG